jgi:5-(carboxyamino)imidazole ribonucleotide synthase
MIPPGKTIGVLGGGQLGRMFAHAAEQLGYRVHIYEPARHSPAGEVSAREVNAPYTDVEQLTAFVKTCDVVTYEFENIPVEPLWAVEKKALLHPHSNVLEVCQNRMREKTWLKKNGFPYVPFTEVEAGDDLEAGIRRIGTPCVVKTADFGYDGKGQLKVTDAASAAKAVAAFARQRAVVEKFIDFKCELSVIVARTEKGEMRAFPVAENIHTKHILDFSIAPARVVMPSASKRRTSARPSRKSWASSACSPWSSFSPIAGRFSSTSWPRARTIQGTTRWTRAQPRSLNSTCAPFAVFPSAAWP